MARRIENTPACIEMRLPQTTREKVSRPRSSVPNGCATVGALRICFQSVCSGSTPAIHGAPIAIATKKSTTAAPIADAGRRRACRQARRKRPAGSVAGARASAAAVVAALGLTGPAPDADAGVEERIGHVHKKIDQHVGAGRDEHDSLDERIVRVNTASAISRTEAGTTKNC